MQSDRRLPCILDCNIMCYSGTSFILLSCLQSFGALHFLDSCCFGRGVTYKSCYAVLYLVVCLLPPHSKGTGITSLWVHAIRTALSTTEPYLEAEFGVS